MGNVEVTQVLFECCVRFLRFFTFPDPKISGSQIDGVICTGLAFSAGYTRFESMQTVMVVTAFTCTESSKVFSVGTFCINKIK